ncbi:MAG: chromate transporter [Candidatus Poribacteria bacterium]|nr:chromate transporter [Candidatus Poribacteria bacterium]
MLSLVLTFLKLGAFIFGSGHALASAMQNELVDKRGWLTAEQFQEGWATGNVLPGPIATKVVAYVGYQQMGVLGAFIATVAYLAPSIAGMTLLAAALSYQGGSDGMNRVLAGMNAAVKGIKPAVLALLVDAFLSFTGVAYPKSSELGANWLPFGVMILGVIVSLGGAWWLSQSDGGKYLLGDGRSLFIFAASLLAMLALRIDTIFVMLGAAAIGLSYLVI